MRTVERITRRMFPAGLAVALGALAGGVSDAEDDERRGAAAALDPQHLDLELFTERFARPHDELGVDSDKPPQRLQLALEPLAIEGEQQRERQGQADDSDEDDREHHPTQSARVAARLSGESSAS